MSACPICESTNPAARYSDTCVVHRVEDELPAHYFDCERFNVTNYGTRQGKCDCTATQDIQQLLDLLADLRAASQTSTGVDAVPAASLVESSAQSAAAPAGRAAEPNGPYPSSAFRPEGT